jgi:uridylate kinase
MLYKRILLKLSGESLGGPRGAGLDAARLSSYARQVSEVSRSGVEIGIVVGGGNIFRGLGAALPGVDRVKGDQIGMLATVINALALGAALDAEGCPNNLLTATRVEPAGERYSTALAREYLRAGRVVIFGGGTGNPFFTTDTASALRAVEIGASVLLKGTRVDGVYTADPEKDPSATRLDRLSHDEVYRRGLKVMDLTATTLCKENNLPVIVFNMEVEGNLARVTRGEAVGTLVS